MSERNNNSVQDVLTVVHRYELKVLHRYELKVIHRYELKAIRRYALQNGRSLEERNVFIYEFRK